MTVSTLSRSQSQFYTEFVMARNTIDLAQWGVSMDLEEFKDQMVEELNREFRGSLSLDELLLRPRLAAAFCDGIKLRKGFYDLPDDVILRSIMQRRKNP